MADSGLSEPCGREPQTLSALCLPSCQCSRTLLVNVKIYSFNCMLAVLFILRDGGRDGRRGAVVDFSACVLSHQSH